MSSKAHKQLVWNLIKNIKVGMLVTKDNDAEENLRARPMHLVQDEYDGTLYFYTPISDAKVFEVSQNHQVCITFSDPSKQTYVSLSGTAQLSRDPELIEKYWNAWVGAWFKQGKKDPDLGMLKVKIHKGEHWDTQENKLIQLFEIAKANLHEEAIPDFGENQKFG